MARPKRPQPIEHHQQAGPHVDEHGHPHGRAVEQGQKQENRLDAQSQGDVLPEKGLCLAREPDGLWDAAQSMVGMRKTGMP